MSDPDFYRILGVTLRASADEIKAAYRELVKKYHPDLFPTTGAKAEATEKLWLVNEAYAVLGNAKRRQKYDQRFIQTPKQAARAPAGGRRERPRFLHNNGLRKKIEKIKILKHGLHFSKKQTAYTVLSTVLVLIVIYATRSEPKVVLGYTLFEKLEAPPSKNASASEAGGKGWIAVAQYASVSECAERLKERVRMDEQQGSRAVFGDPNGTMAITVLVTKESEHGRENSIPAEPDRSAADESTSQSQQQRREEKSESAEGRMTKRVRNLECYATQRLVSDSWLRRILR
jgi:curved DNA-binding protein CbpA